MQHSPLRWPPLRTPSDTEVSIIADYVEVTDGTTVAQLFERQIGSTEPSHYLIRDNRQPCPSNQVLQEGDRISITPTKIEGAA